MAKKSSKKNNLLFSLLAFMFGGAVFGLLAMPYINNKFTILGSETITGFSGYSLLDFDANQIFAILTLLLVIFAGLTALFGLLKLAYDAKLVSNKAFGKFVGFGLIISSLALLVTSIVTMIIIPTECSEVALGGLLSSGNYANWLALILTTVSSGLSFVTSLLAIKK